MGAPAISYRDDDQTLVLRRLGTNHYFVGSGVRWANGLTVDEALFAAAAWLLGKPCGWLRTDEENGADDRRLFEPKRDLNAKPVPEPVAPVDSGPCSECGFGDTVMCAAGCGVALCRNHELLHLTEKHPDWRPF